MHSSDLEKVPQPSPEMTGQRRAVDHFGLRGSGSDTKLSLPAASPSTVSLHIHTMPHYLLCLHLYMRLNLLQVHTPVCTYVYYIIHVHCSTLFRCMQLRSWIIQFCFIVQVHRLRSSRSSGSSGFGFSSHSHAKFVSQLMRESRLRVSTLIHVH